MSLDDLFHAMQAGEPRAEQRLFRRIRVELLPFFKRRVNPSDVEDITQDSLAVIVRVLQAKPFVPKHRSSFRSFTFVVAHIHLWVHRTKTQRRHRALPSVDSWWLALNSGADSPDELTLSQQQAELLQVAMAALKTNYRRALESRLRDQDPQEFADAEGIKLGTVRSRICRALVFLSAEIQARRKTVLT